MEHTPGTAMVRDRLHRARQRLAWLAGLKTSRTLLVATLLLLFLPAVTARTTIFYENWEDGSDDGWSTNYDCGWGIQSNEGPGDYTVEMGDGYSYIWDYVDVPSNMRNVRVKYWGGTSSMDDSGEDGWFEWYDGSDWHNNLIQHQNDAEEYHYYDIPNSWINDGGTERIQFYLDGSGCGDHFWVDEIEVMGDYMPSIGDPSFTNDGNNHAFTVSAIADDNDGDNEISCDLYVDDNDGNSQSYSMNVNEGYGDGTQAECTATVQYSDQGGWGHTENMDIRVNVDDSDGYSDNNYGSHAFPNHAPSISSGNSFSDSDSAHAFTVSAMGRDTDAGDGEFNSCTVIHDDGDGNSYTTSGSLNTGAGGGDEAQCTYTIESSGSGGFSGYQAGESINVQVRFQDDHGSTATTATDSHTIPNRAPTIAASTNFTDSADTHEFTISATGNDVDEGASEINSCTVLVDDGDGNSYSPSGSLNTSVGGTDDVGCSYTVGSAEAGGFSGFKTGESINVQVRFTDLHGTSVTTGTDSHTIPNRAPTLVTDTNFNNASTQHAFTISAVAEDVDQGKDELASCEARFSDSDGNTITRSGSLNTGYGSTDEARCTYQLDNTVSGFTVGESIQSDILFRDRHSSTVRSTTMSNSFPNSAPVIEERESFPSQVDYGTDVHLRINVSDVEDPTTWANLTVEENGNVIVDNVNSSKNVIGVFDLWNTTQFTLDEEQGIYNWTVTVSDGYTTSTTEGSFVLQDVGPTASIRYTRLPTPWNIKASTFRSDGRFIAQATVKDGNGRDDITDHYLNLTRPDGTQVLSFASPDSEDRLINGYNMTLSYDFSDAAPTGQWNLTVGVADTDNLRDADSTTVETASLSTSTIAARFPNNGNWTGYIDGDQASPGTYSSLPFPYFAATDPPLLTGLINYGSFQRLAYSRSNDWHWANMTQTFDGNRYLLPYTRADIFELEEHQGSMTAGALGSRTFLTQVTSNIGYEVTDQKHVRVVLDYSGSDINITGFQGSIGGGIHSIRIVNQGVTNNHVQIQIGRVRLD